jgi:hypothetical protein
MDHFNRFVTKGQAELQVLLDSMIPRRYSERVRAGRVVADPHDHATVLFVSFPKENTSHVGEGGSNGGAAGMEAFRLQDLIFTEFDRLVSFF